jgi:ubiquinone/menaquinone biosynthesis C-methylase UbiE
MALPSYAMNQLSFPEMYEHFLVGPLFRPWAEIALEEVKLSKGDRVLDVACGTGIVARVARERLGDGKGIVGIDISADMLAIARAVAPDIDWRTGSAAALPRHENERFAVVVCQQGLQFFPDKRAAASELLRALKSGGRLAILTWRSDSEIPQFRELRQEAERHLGAIADQRHSFGDGTALEALFWDAGFEDVRSRTISRTIRFEDGAPFLRMNTMALVSMSAAGKTMSDADRKRVLETIIGDSAPVLQRYSDGPVLAFELSTNLLTATAR